MTELSKGPGSRKLRRLKEYREKRELTVKELASRSEITEESINALEAGRANATIRTAEALANPLRCHKEDLIGGKERPGDWTEVEAASPEIDPPDDH
ncbi:MAG: helix-turn-helix transcriptional regulator [Actinomycetota bacterium]|nr:helix-turn-helix transcriptional regulator [Actinomycetota bacterium]